MSNPGEENFYPSYNFRFPVEEVGVTYQFENIVEECSNQTSQACSQDLQYRELIRQQFPNKEIPDNVPAAYAYSVFQQGGIFLPCVIDGEQIFVPIFPNWTTEDLLNEVFKYVFRGNLFVLFNDGTDKSLGILPPEEISFNPTLSQPDQRGRSVFFSGVQLNVL